ncbi:MAG: DNA-directed RNA polymerase [Candidatus ainarchaeum sp.]|nr:DNA-directed RNA polymerase [Candidatus ainarchaeum sp.]
MFYKTKIMDKVRVPPKKLGGKIKQSLLEICKEDYEGKLNPEYGLIVAVTGIDDVGEGYVIPGDGSAFYEAEIEMITYKPLLQEIVRGQITEATEFGAFLRVGPIEGLIHVSQLMDDFINYDAKLPGFIGKKTEKRIVAEDTVLARVVTISLKGDVPSSKIGLTMRQPFLGKEDWAGIDSKASDKANKQAQKEAKKADNAGQAKPTAKGGKK